MTSQDDLGMLWYGVSGVSFNPTDPSDVMLNTGTAAPMLSDHPRPIIATQLAHGSLNSQCTIAAPFSDPNALPQQSQLLFDPNTGDYVTQPDFMYETYESFEEDSSNNAINQSRPHLNSFSNQLSQISEDDPNLLTKTKKPKVHQHPSLKLQTPIAYQKDTDIDAIPIMKEGMAVCEKCGAIGVRHAFYGKERKFCSLACARPPSIPVSLARFTANNAEIFKMKRESMEEDPLKLQQNPEENHIESAINSVISRCERNSLTYVVKNEDDYGHDAESSTSISGNEINTFIGPDISPPPLSNQSNNRTFKNLSNSYNWESSYFLDETFVAAPVQFFKHAPMCECWEQISPGMKVEVSCREEALMEDSFWVATVLTIAGYKAQLRFEGFVDDNSKDFWVDLCSEEVHPVGWCAMQGKALIPPKSIQNKYQDWKEFLMRRLTGARTLPTNFQSKVAESQTSRFSSVEFDDFFHY